MILVNEREKIRVKTNNYVLPLYFLEIILSFFHRVINTYGIWNVCKKHSRVENFRCQTMTQIIGDVRSAFRGEIFILIDNRLSNQNI